MKQIHVFRSEQLEMIRYFGDSIFNSKITIGETGIKQNNCFE